MPSQTNTTNIPTTKTVGGAINLVRDVRFPFLANQKIVVRLSKEETDQEVALLAMKNLECAVISGLELDTTYLLKMRTEPCGCWREGQRLSLKLSAEKPLLHLVVRYEGYCRALWAECCCFAFGLRQIKAREVEEEEVEAVLAHSPEKLRRAKRALRGIMVAGAVTLVANTSRIVNGAVEMY